MAIRHRQSAFTLVELLVVMVIIVILASLALASFSKARINARDGKRKSDVRTYVAALEKFRLTNGTYNLGPIGAGGASYGRMNYKGSASEDGKLYSGTSTLAAILEKADLIDAPLRDPLAKKSDDAPNQPDYILVRCNDAGKQIITASSNDESVAVWTKLENEPNDVDVENARLSCGGSSIANIPATSFASENMEAPIGTNAEKDLHYFAAGTLLRKLP